MRHNIAEGDIVLDHKVGRESCGAVHGGAEVAAALFTHFDADAVTVTGAIKVGVFSLLVGRHVLDGDAVINSEVPDQIADAIAAAAFRRAQGTVFESLRMFPCVRRPILCAVNGNVARRH